MSNQIKLGYSMPDGKEVFVKPSHVIVTGITQQSGKSTTMEAMLLRSTFRSIVFKTKIGEKSFQKGTVVAPFFRDRSDYEFVRSLIEAYAKEKLTIEKGTLMTLCKGSNNLIEIKKRVDERLTPTDQKTKRPTGINLEIFTRLQHYLENLIPQIQYAAFSSTLNLVDGINIMNLERFTEEAQSLIIQSVAEEVLKNHHDIILVIPEAWKFIPQKYNNPCKRVVESFIRQGATNHNFIWLDSQDMAGVDKIPLKQISTWILGYQSERNEVKHTLDQISLPKASKPKEDDIMNLGIGQFYLSDRDGVKKVYVQPHWIDDEKAIMVATGKEDSVNVALLKPLAQLNIPVVQTKSEEKPSTSPEGLATKKELAQMRLDFFAKIEDILTQVQNAFANMGTPAAAAPSMDINDIVGLVLQKMPARSSTIAAPVSVDTAAIVKEVLKQIPVGQGSVTYSVAPLVKIKKDFLIETKDKIVKAAMELDEQQKRMLKWIEQNEKNTTKAEIFRNCFGESATSGSTYTSLTKKIGDVRNEGLVRIDTAQRIYPNLKAKIKELIEQYGATDAEINNVYDHILAEILK